MFVLWLRNGCPFSARGGRLGGLFCESNWEVCTVLRIRASGFFTEKMDIKNKALRREERKHTETQTHTPERRTRNEKRSEVMHLEGFLPVLLFHSKASRHLSFEIEGKPGWLFGMPSLGDIAHFNPNSKSKDNSKPNYGNMCEKVSHPKAGWSVDAKTPPSHANRWDASL